LACAAKHIPPKQQGLFTSFFLIFYLEITMNQRAFIAAAAASVLAMGFAGVAHAQDSGKEKCYGIAKAGQNDCASLSGTHSCAGQSKMDMSPDSWKHVAKGSCKGMKGLTAAEAKAKMDMAKKG
jgi:uncharacterized membrane protein